MCRTVFRRSSPEVEVEADTGVHDERIDVGADPGLQRIP